MSYSRFVVQLLVDNRGEGERGPQMLFEIWQSAFFIKKMGGKPIWGHETRNALSLTYTDQCSVVNINSMSEMANESQCVTRMNSSKKCRARVCVWNFRNATFQNDLGHASRNQDAVRADQNNTLYTAMSKISVGSYCIFRIGFTTHFKWQQGTVTVYNPWTITLGIYMFCFCILNYMHTFYLLRLNQKRASEVIILVRLKLCVFCCPVTSDGASRCLSSPSVCLS